MELFKIVGGRFTFLNFVFLIIWLFLPINKIRNITARYIYIIIIYSLLSLQFISLTITGKFIGYEFLVHTNIYDILSMVKFYPSVILYFSVYTLIFILVINIITKHNINYPEILSLSRFIIQNKYKKMLYLIFIIISIKVFTMESAYNKKGVIKKTIETYSFLLSSTEQSFVQSLQEIGMNNYVSKNSLKGNGNNKDIIIISLESFESGLLNVNNSKLTPFVNELKKKWKFLKINQNIGSNWTSGSLYTMFTGIPAFFAVYHNSIFQNSYRKEIVGLPDILKEVGYDLTYITKDANFSGTRSLLGCFNFDKVIDGNELGNGHDKDIFDKIKLEISKNKNSGTKFSIFASTLDTHGPNGIKDHRFKKQFLNLDGLEYSTAVLDYLMNDFYSFMKENSYLESTTIIFITDHLYMVKPPIINSAEERKIIYLTNSKNSTFENNLDTFYQVHMPNLILASCGINHNIKFFPDYFESISDSFILENQVNITNLNLTGFKIANLNYNLESDVNVKHELNTEMLIAHAGGEIDGHVYTNSLEALNNSYRKGFRLFELDINKTSDGIYVAVHNWEEWAQRVNYTDNLPPNHNTFKNLKIHGYLTPIDVTDINNWFGKHNDAILVTDKVNNPIQFSRLIKFKNRLMMELFDLDSAYSARELGIDVLLSENVIKERNLNFEKIKDLQIDKIAISHQYALNNDDKIIRFWEEGITPYIYGTNDYFVGGNVLFNENFLTKNNIFQFQFGIYADKYPK